MATYDLPSEILPMFGSTSKDVNNLPSDVTMFGKPGLSGVSEAPTPMPPQVLPNSVPMPPAGYMPQPLPESGGVISDWLDRVTGQGVPYSLKLRILQAEVRQKEQDVATGWQNYNKTSIAMKGLVEKQNADATDDFYRYWPNALADMTAVPAGPERDRRGDSWLRLIGTLHPEGAAMINYAKKNAASVFAANYMIRHSPELQQQVASRGYLPTIQDEHFKPAQDALGMDMLSSAAGRAMADPEFRDKQHSGKMTESEFLKGIKKAGFDVTMGEPIQPDAMQFIEEFAQSPKGQDTVAGFRVNLAKTARIQQEKHATLPLNKQEEEQRLLEIKDKIENGTATAEDMKDYERFTGTRSKESDIGNRPQGQLDKFMISASKGIAKSYSDWADQHREAVAAGDVNKLTQLAQWDAQAQKLYGQVVPQGRTDVLRNTPVTYKDEVYSKSEALKGNVVRLTENLPTPNEIQSGKTNAVYIDQKVVDSIKDLNIAAGQADQMFTMAGKILTATSTAGALSQRTNEALVKQGIYLGADSDYWKVYIDSKQAWASRLARAIGTERGVMTDTDVLRWEAVLPKSSDTANVVRLKKEAFYKIYGYIKSIALEVGAGVRQDDIVNADRTSYTDKKVASKINGMLGDFEHKVNVAQSKSDATGELQQRKSAAERFMEKHQ